MECSNHSHWHHHLKFLHYAGFQLIHYAVEGGSRESVKFLIEHGFGNPDQSQDGRAFTPLHLASRAGHADLVSLLLNVGYQADRPDKDGRTPLHCAALGVHVGWVEANQQNHMQNPSRCHQNAETRWKCLQARASSPIKESVLVMNDKAQLQ